jgi:hypothetical protein
VTQADPPPTAVQARRSSGSTVTVLGAAAISGLSGYVALFAAARTLSKSDNADFLVFWGVVFAIYGVLIGITTETTRAVTVARSNGGDAGAGTRLMPIALGFGLALVAAVALTGPVWAPWFYADRWGPTYVATVVGATLFVFHATIGGVTSGRGAWTGYSLLVAGESVTRLVLFVVVGLTVATVAGFALTSAIASGFWVAATLASRRYRDLWNQRIVVDPRGFVRRLVTACTAAGVSALLLVGYPVLLKVSLPDDMFASTAPIALAVSLCRAPLLVPLGAYQNVVVARVVAHGARALVPVVMALSALTVLGSIAAWPIGPWVLRVVNPDYHVDGPVFAGLVLGAGLVSVLYVTGAAALALDHHVVYLTGWVAATVAAVVTLLVPWDLETRVVSSLLVGPAVGVAVHLLGGRTRIG